MIVRWICLFSGSIHRAGSVHPINQDDLQLVLAGGIGEFRRVTGGFHCRLSVSLSIGW